MARRKDEPRFELGGYWLGRVHGSTYWYRFWYDRKTGRVRRRSLGTEALEEAKTKLAAIVTTRGTSEPDSGPIPQPHNVLIVSVLNHYLEHRAKDLPSAEQAERAIALLVEFLFTVKKLPTRAKADCFTLDLQIAYVKWRAAQGHSAAYIARSMNVIAAAMHYAAEPNAISDEDDGETIIHLMSSAPPVRYDAQWIAEVADIAPPRTREWLPSYEELARFIDTIHSEHIFRFVILVLNTWARRETIESLDIRRQIDFTRGIVDLNAPGRRQTKKVRPKIRLTRNLRAWAELWRVHTPRPLTYKSDLVDGEKVPRVVSTVKKAMQATNARWMMREAGLKGEEIARLMVPANYKERTKKLQELEAAGYHRITSRVIRSFMATSVRGIREIRVDREQRQVWLGHGRKDTTALYEVTDPDYLREAAEATDLIIDKLDALCRRSLWPVGVQPELPLFAEEDEPAPTRKALANLPPLAGETKTGRGSD